MTHRNVPAALAAALLCFSVHAETLPFAESTGHEFGGRITQSHEAEAWLKRLAEVSPRVTYELQGRSWERRPLMLVTITSPENHARIGEIKDVARRMDDARLPAPTAEELANQPVIVWLGGSIHGFELSGTEGALKVVDHLVNSDDAETRRLLEHAVVLVDPMLNPDGRDAFAQRNHRSIGRFINASGDDWSNDFTSWDALQYRTGHYNFDTNRDWFAHTQMETRGRMPTFREWRPQVAVDMHEMGADREFFFDPPTQPSAPFFPEYATKGFEIFGAAYAAAFDRAGFEYTTRQFYNYFYPGYTTSWTSYQGAIGMLYEQGSSRGLALERGDDTVRTLGDALDQQYTAAMTLVRTAVANRDRLLRDYTAAGREALADGRRGVRRYLVAPTGDPQLHAELAALLERNGVEVQVLKESATVRGLRDGRGAGVRSADFAPGTLVIEADQPRNRLIRTLLERHLPMPEAFLEQARERLERGENPRFYDITAYSLPLLFDLPGYSATDGRDLPVVRWTPTAPAAPALAEYAWLIDGRQAASAAAAALLRRDGIRVSIATDPFRHGGYDYASGTAIVRVADDAEAMHIRISDLALEFGLEVRTAATGLAERGLPALGAGETFSIKAPEVALLAEMPIHGYSFGWAWHTLDAQYRIPTTVLRTRSLGSTPLERFTTIVVPQLIGGGGELDRLLGDDGKARLKRWVDDGGTLVAIGSGADWVRDTLELASLRDWYKVNEESEPQKIDVPGSFVRVVFDEETWMSSGYGADAPMLVMSDRLWLEPEGAPDPRKRVVGRYAGGDSLHIAGHLWRENTERLPGAVFAWEERHGRGRVVLFAEDLNFRGYWRGADRLFLNAVLLGPSAP